FNTKCQKYQTCISNKEIHWQETEGHKMRFQEKLSEYSKEEIWNEYCGFLDLDIEEYMTIQKRLLMEQMRLWGESVLGKSILKGPIPTTLEEFREYVPLTTYEDYASLLLGKQS